MTHSMNGDGSWTVFLNAPIPGKDGGTTQIKIRPFTLDHLIRWTTGEIPSTLALLAEVSGIAEMNLRQIQYPDMDRVLLAFVTMMPDPIRKDFQEGKKPFFTYVEPHVVETPDGKTVVIPESRPNDPEDPRFPYDPLVDRNAKRPEPDQPPQSQSQPAQADPGIEDDGFGIGPKTSPATKIT